MARNKKNFPLWILFLSTLCIFITSCNKNKTINADFNETAIPSVFPNKVNNDKIIHWNLEKNNAEGDFFKTMVDSIKLIDLETSQKCMIGQVTGVMAYKDKLIIVDGQKAQTISVFDNKGNFLYHIGSKGKANNEYMSLNGVRLLGDTIVVNDWLKPALIMYNVSGIFLKTISFANNRAEDVFPLIGDSIFVASYAGYFPNHPFHITWFNTNDTLLGTALPFTNARPCAAGALQRTSNNGVIFNYKLCDTVYKVGAKELTPIIVLGLHNKRQTDDFFIKNKSKNNTEFNQAMFNSDKITYSCDITECENYWLVYHQKYPSSYLSIIDKKTNKSQTFLRSDLKKQEAKIPFVIHNAHQDWLLSFIDEQFFDVVDSKNRDSFLNLLSAQQRNMLRQHKFSTQNPIICMFHLKQGAIK